MTDNTINNDMTMGGATGALLAGRYRVVRQLGQGWMGSVWLAEDEKLDGFKVAIKMLPSILVNNKRAYAQVKAEALVSLKLSHPNIATIRAFEEENGNPFLVMDYIAGRTLDDYLAEKGTLTEEETIRLLTPIAAALDYAHLQGVVHRDVKPGNVMIRKDGTPFVLDFGIAREIQETMTRVTGKLSSGTLMYMSPEQLNGAAPKPAQDVYSFAAMAYECLKGEPPFSRGQIEYQIVNNQPEPLGPQFAKSGAGVMAGLAKMAEERPTTCAAVLAGETQGNGLTGKGGTRSVASAGKGGALVGIAAALALAALGGWWWQGRKASGTSGTSGTTAVVSSVPEDPPVTKVPVAPPALPVDEEAERRRLELKAETAVYSLSVEMESASRLIAGESGDVRVFFAPEIRAFEKMRQAGNDAKANRSYVTATNFFAQAKAKADALKELVTARANCLAAKDRAEAAKRSADEVDAKSALALRYEEADKALGQVASLAEKRDFAAASACAEAARGQFAALRADVIKVALDAAERHQAAERWEQCLVAAEKVLGWEPQNAKAAALKREVESHLKPSLRFVAKIGEREVPATAMFDGKPFKSPWVWDKDVRDGRRIPSSDVTVEYSEGGKRYEGTMKPVTVDWKGLKTVAVALTEYKGPKPGEKAGDSMTITLPGGATMEMVWCSAGSFMMGSPESEKDRCCDEAQHRVTLTQGFWMGKYEVTQRQWESVMGSNPSSLRGANRPVERVSWDDCQEFIRKINAVGRVQVSLPTEAQWEYACRAGTTTPFNFGSILNGDKANCDGNYPYGTSVKGRYRNETTDVGSYAPNAWNLHDMHGNVREWCSDWKGDCTSDATDPTGPASGASRVFRGGGWNSYAQNCRSAYRCGLEPGNRGNGLGLRLVCSAGPRR